MSILTALRGRASTREPLSILREPLSVEEILAALSTLAELKQAGDDPERDGRP